MNKIIRCPTCSGHGTLVVSDEYNPGLVDADKSVNAEIGRSANKAISDLRRTLRVPEGHSVFEHAERVMRELDSLRSSLVSNKD